MKKLIVLSCFLCFATLSANIFDFFDEQFCTNQMRFNKCTISPTQSNFMRLFINLERITSTLVKIVELSPRATVGESEALNEKMERIINRTFCIHARLLAFLTKPSMKFDRATYDELLRIEHDLHFAYHQLTREYQTPIIYSTLI